MTGNIQTKQFQFAFYVDEDCSNCFSESIIKRYDMPEIWSLTVPVLTVSSVHHSMACSPTAGRSSGTMISWFVVVCLLCLILIFLSRVLLIGTFKWPTRLWRLNSSHHALGISYNSCAEGERNTTVTGRKYVSSEKGKRNVKMKGYRRFERYRWQAAKSSSVKILLYSRLRWSRCSSSTLLLFREERLAIYESLITICSSDICELYSSISEEKRTWFERFGTVVRCGVRRLNIQLD